MNTEKEKSLPNDLLIMALNRVNHLSDNISLISKSITHLEECILGLNHNDVKLKEDILNVKEKLKKYYNSEQILRNDFKRNIEEKVLFLESENKKRKIIDIEEIKHKKKDLKRLKFLYALIAALITIFGFGNLESKEIITKFSHIF